MPITTAQAVVERFERLYARHLSRAGRSGPEGSRASRRALGRAEIGAARGVWSAPACAAPGSGSPATAEAGPAYASAPANAYSGPGGVHVFTLSGKEHWWAEPPDGLI